MTDRPRYRSHNPQYRFVGYCGHYDVWFCEYEEPEPKNRNGWNQAIILRYGGEWHEYTKRYVAQAYDFKNTPPFESALNIVRRAGLIPND